MYEDSHWRVEHIIEPIPMVGWLIAKPLRHVTSFAELTLDEAASFGPLMRRVVAALTAVLAPAKVYLCLFAEAENFAHLHFHLIPRAPDLPPSRRGPGVFDLVAKASAEGNLADVSLAITVAHRVRDLLLEGRSAPPG